MSFHRSEVDVLIELTRDLDKSGQAAMLGSQTLWFSFGELVGFEREVYDAKGVRWVLRREEGLRRKDSGLCGDGRILWNAYKQIQVFTGERERERERNETKNGIHNETCNSFASESRNSLSHSTSKRD